MGVYIKDIEMPKGADEHRLIIRANGQVIIDKKTYWEEAEAVHVPPHGRLIDEDVLIKTAHNQWPLPIDFLKLLELVPTVIPADGKDIEVPTRKEEV